MRNDGHNHDEHNHDEHKYAPHDALAAPAQTQANTAVAHTSLANGVAAMSATEEATRPDAAEHRAPPAPLALPRTIALVGKYHNPDIAESLCCLIEYLHQQGITLLIEEETASHIPLPMRSAVNALAAPPEVGLCTPSSFAEIGAAADLVIVLGGDGTMLNAARQLAYARVPLVGVNQGRLGFMTDIARGDMLSSMAELLAGKFTCETRMLLDVEVLREAPGQQAQSLFSSLALNDVVVDKGAIGRMIEFELFIDQQFIYSLRSDGLIVSTPTGSTAYSLSANGPILHPQVAGIALVPLCPHALSNRPILVGDNSEIEIRIVQATDSRVYVDGQVSLDMQPGDSVRIRRSLHSTYFLHPPGYSYFAMLRQKLHWSEQPKGH